MAVDWHPSTFITPDHVRRLAIQYGFTGVGFYPTWNKPGYHFDVRPGPFGKAATWGRVHDDYVSWDEAVDYYQNFVL